MQLVRDIGTLIGRIPIHGVPIADAEHVRHTLTAALDDIARSLDAGRAPVDPGDLTACLDAAHDALARAEASGEVPVGLASALDILDPIAASITRIAGEAERWAQAQRPGRPAWWTRLAPQRPSRTG